MSANCRTQRDYYTKDRQRDKRYCRVLWAVLGVNAAMFLVEIVAGLAAGSVSLQAAALDFLADAGNYGISLFVVGHGPTLSGTSSAR
jgi:Co/Zn/Cd efflux system component